MNSGGHLLNLSEAIKMNICEQKEALLISASEKIKALQLKHTGVYLFHLSGGKN
ncbi:hypothetical protein JHC27_05420 [archaeon]|nr:hypothetical protein [archaeon]